MSDAYRFPGLPLEPMEPGSTVLLAGPSHSGTRRLLLRLVAGRPDEATLAVTTNTRAARLLKRCRAVGMDIDPARLGFIDCVGSDQRVEGCPVKPVSSPEDLTGIGMRYSSLYREFYHDGYHRVRTGVGSISTLLSFNELRPVSRFLHAMAGRVDSADGLGVLLVDPRMHDPRTMSTIAQFCEGRVDVEERDGEPHLRTRGLSGQPRDWVPFAPEPSD